MVFYGPSTTRVILGTLTYLTLMRSGNNIHVQLDKHDKCGMEQKTKLCPFCRLLRHACCHVCSARWNSRCVDRGTAVVYFYIPINPHGVPQANWFPFHTPFTSRKKYRIWNKNCPACCSPTNYGESSRSSLILVACYDMPQRKAEVLFHTVKNTHFIIPNSFFLLSC